MKVHMLFVLSIFISYNAMYKVNYESHEEKSCSNDTLVLLLY